MPVDADDPIVPPPAPPAQVPAPVSDTEEADSSPDPSVGRLGSHLLSSLILDQSHPSLAAVKNLGAGGCRQFPLEDLQEACLLKHFIDHVAPWVRACKNALCYFF